MFTVLSDGFKLLAGMTNCPSSRVVLGRWSEPNVGTSKTAENMNGTCGYNPARPMAFLPAGLLCLALSVFAQDETDEGQGPVPGTAEYAWKHGCRMLCEERWTEAAEVHGTFFSTLETNVRMAWEQAESKPEPKRTGFRRALLDFYFRCMSLADIVLCEKAMDLVDFAEAYRKLPRRGSQASIEKRPDLNYIDLLKAVEKKMRAKEPLNNEYLAALGALHERPDALPALAAYAISMSEKARREQGESKYLCVDAERLYGRCGEVGKLTIARTLIRLFSPQGRALIDDNILRKVLEGSWNFAPSRAERALMLYTLARAEMYTTNLTESGKPVCVATVESVLAKFPDTPSAVEAADLATEVLLRSHGVEGVLEWVRQREANLPAAMPQGALLYKIAGHCMNDYWPENLKRAELLLLEIIERFPTSPTCSAAMLSLAGLCMRQNRKDEYEQWLKRCAKSPVTTPTGRSLMDTDNTASVAIQQLAYLCEREERWSEALEWWEAWQPQSWCRNCWLGMRARKEMGIGRCLEHLGRFDEAARPQSDRAKREGKSFSASSRAFPHRSRRMPYETSQEYSGKTIRRVLPGPLRSRPRGGKSCCLSSRAKKVRYRLKR